MSGSLDSEEARPKMINSVLSVFRDGPFDIQGGGWDFFEKNSLFPYRSEKNKMSSTKLKINSLFFIQQILTEALLPSEL